jgi:hypothetical protein
MKTVYITRNELLKPISMIMCNNITQDDSFIEDNSELFTIECEACEGSGNIEEDKTCDDCGGSGYHDLEPYQFFITDADKYEIERLKEYGMQVGYSESLDLNVIAIYDFGTGWGAFSYSKEVDDDYELAHNETLERKTVY